MSGINPRYDFSMYTCMYNGIAKPGPAWILAPAIQVNAVRGHNYSRSATQLAKCISCPVSATLSCLLHK